MTEDMNSRQTPTATKECILSLSPQIKIQAYKITTNTSSLLMYVLLSSPF